VGKGGMEERNFGVVSLRGDTGRMGCRIGWAGEMSEGKEVRRWTRVRTGKRRLKGCRGQMGGLRSNGAESRRENRGGWRCSTRKIMES
jgi:hypothetical protein